MDSKTFDLQKFVSVAASLTASSMLLRRIVQDFIPHEIQNFFFSRITGFSRRFSSEVTIVIHEQQGHSPNEVFEAVEFYLATKVNKSLLKRVKVGKTEEDKKLAITMDKDEEIIDVYNKINTRWRFFTTKVESSNGDHDVVQSFKRAYELSFHKRDREEVLNSYLPYILDRAKSIKEESKAIKLHTAQYGCSWQSNPINLDHPMNFKTLALDSGVKQAVLDDLNTFREGKEYYRRIGKAWKRGYLLYGPPGTGKSSLIAAMANYLKYDIYDLDLTDLRCNNGLRTLLLGMSNRSILVIEDIDCSIKLENRDTDDAENNNGENKVTLSGLLNFIDGLLSCIGEERIIVFTTNHKDRLDPALLRPGRMDMHVLMSYCTVSAFKQLALNYLGITHHDLFEIIRGLIEETLVTPAEVSGELMKSSDTEVSLQGLIIFLQTKSNASEITVRVESNGKNKPNEDYRITRKGGKRVRGGTRRRGNFINGR